MQEIILDIVKTIVIALSGLITFYIQTNKEKKKNEKIDKTEHDKMFETINLLKDENKKIRKDISTISTSLSAIQDNEKHVNFKDSFSAKLQIESTQFIYSMVKNNAELQLFLSSGVKRALSIFLNILNVGFENVTRQMLETWFSIANKSLRLEFSGKKINLDSNKVKRIITTERDNYMYKLFQLNKRCKENKECNGIRRAGFEKISKEFLNEIIKNISSLQTEK